MRPTIQPRLLNSSFGDPLLFINLAFRKQALLFDLGDLSQLSAKDSLKISHIFISHTHMDHFIGFDQILRLLLGRPKMIHLFGPQGIIKNVTGKLESYTWNLVNNYADALQIKVTEIKGNLHITSAFDGRSGFTPIPIQSEPGDTSIIWKSPEFTVNAAILDHRIPCLGFSVIERFHVNIIKTRLETLGLSVGPWLQRLKTMIFEDADPATQIEAPKNTATDEVVSLKLENLINDIVRITPGQKIAYITDVVYSKSNEKKIVQLAEKADQLFIEAAFLESEQHVAREKYHLTAKQAGIIARKAGVKQIIVFHHSPRYLGQAHLLVEEAAQAFTGSPIN